MLNWGQAPPPPGAPWTQAELTRLRQMALLPDFYTVARIMEHLKKSEVDVIMKLNELKGY